jgi:hypothetical protein
MLVHGEREVPVDVPHVVGMRAQEGIDHRQRLRAERALEVAELDDLEDRALRAAGGRGLSGQRRGRQQKRGQCEGMGRASSRA